MKWGSDTGSGLLASCGAALAIIACYGTLVVVAGLSLAGITIAIHQGIWAGAIVLFAGLALLGIILGWRRHRQFPPLLAGIIGVSVIVFTMVVSYNRFVEIVGFAILIAAVILERRARLNR